MSDKNMALRNDEQPSMDLARSEDGLHYLIHADALELKKAGIRASLVIADPPATPFESPIEETEAFFEQFATALDIHVDRDVALIMVYRERRGTGFLKSVVGTNVLVHHGWNFFREIVWKYSDADFHRARPNFSLIHVFRRGTMPLQDSPMRYKDVVTWKPPTEGDGDKFIMEMPSDLVIDLIQLFARPDTVVFDPFAGTGIVTRCVDVVNFRKGWHIPSTSFELSREQFDTITPHIEALEGGKIPGSYGQS